VKKEKKVKMLRTGSTLAALSAGAWLAGCSSVGAPAPTPAPVSASASTSASTSTPQPSPNASSAPLPTQGEYPGVTVTIQELKRSANALTLRFVMANTSNQSFATYYALFEKQAHSVDGIHLIDPVGKKKYFVVRDSDGACVCSREVQAIAPGSQSVLWAKFPAPPDDVQKITVEIPHFPPFEDVPVSH
jgi:hypothetical protein